MRWFVVTGSWSHDIVHGIKANINNNQMCDRKIEREKEKKIERARERKSTIHITAVCRHAFLRFQEAVGRFGKLKLSKSSHIETKLKLLCVKQQRRKKINEWDESVCITATAMEKWECACARTNTTVKKINAMFLYSFVFLFFLFFLYFL